MRTSQSQRKKIPLHLRLGHPSRKLRCLYPFPISSMQSTHRSSHFCYLRSSVGLPSLHRIIVLRISQTPDWTISCWTFSWPPKRRTLNVQLLCQRIELGRHFWLPWETPMYRDLSNSRNLYRKPLSILNLVKGINVQCKFTSEKNEFSKIFTNCISS